MSIETEKKDELELQLKSLKKEIRISWIIRTIFLSINIGLIIVILCMFFWAKDTVQNAKLVESGKKINEFLNDPDLLNEYISKAIPFNKCPFASIGI